MPLYDIVVILTTITTTSIDLHKAPSPCIAAGSSEIHTHTYATFSRTFRPPRVAACVKKKKDLLRGREVCICFVDGRCGLGAVYVLRRDDTRRLTRRVSDVSFFTPGVTCCRMGRELLYPSERGPCYQDDEHVVLFAVVIMSVGASLEDRRASSLCMCDSGSK